MFKHIVGTNYEVAIIRSELNGKILEIGTHLYDGIYFQTNVGILRITNSRLYLRIPTEGQASVRISSKWFSSIYRLEVIIVSDDKVIEIMGVSKPQSK